MQMFITGLIFFSLLSGSFLFINFAQFKRFRILEIADHDEETTRQFVDWQRTKLSALRCGQVGWIAVFLTSLAVFPWVNKIVPLLAVAAFAVAALWHHFAAKKLKRLPSHLSGQIQSQQGFFKFAWVLPAVVFGGVAMVGLQKVSHMIYEPKQRVADDEKPGSPDEGTITHPVADAIPTPPPLEDPFAE